MSMKTPDSRFFCPLLTIGETILDENESAHAIRVCRATIGDTLLLSDGKGHFANATITCANEKTCKVNISNIETVSETSPKISLAIACLKDDALEEVTFHAAQTELDSIIFLRTDFSQEPKNSDLKKTVRRAELKSLVSLKQSKKPWLTKIEGPIKFADWLNKYYGDIILCDIEGSAPPNMRTLNTPTTLMVGPEGGFSKAEIDAIKNFKNGNVYFMRLGNTRLRARTAAIIALGKLI